MNTLIKAVRLRAPLLLGLLLVCSSTLFIASGLYASEEDSLLRLSGPAGSASYEEQAKRASAELNALVEQEGEDIEKLLLEDNEPKKVDERAAILKEAFNGCKGQKNILTDKQLVSFPADVCEHIASFIHGDIKKLKFVAGHVRQCIPAVMTAQDNTPIFGPMTQAIMNFDDNPKIPLVVKFRGKFTKYEGDRSFILRRWGADTIIYVIHSEYIKDLVRLTQSQLNYITWLSDTRAELEYKACFSDTKAPVTQKERLEIRNRVKKLLHDDPTKFELLKRQMIEAKKLVRTPEQLAIHHSLPTDMRQCIEANYIFAPVGTMDTSARSSIIVSY